MAYLPLEDLLPRAAFSSYKLVRMVAARALEIGDGGAKLIDASINEKPATTAMREIIAGRVMTKEASDIMKKAAKAAKHAA
ncbi:MAG: DNA-directed RNA polymerase subunit omega [Candidatus Omnitrophota bacterium]